MPYAINYRSDWDEEYQYFVEKNKDEVIDRLIWLLRRMEHQATVEYPDGEIY